MLFLNIVRSLIDDLGEKLAILLFEEIDRLAGGGLYHIETSPLICSKTMDWFLYDQDLRH